MDAKEIVAAYDELMARAIMITGDAPFFMYVDHENLARLSFDGDEAVLSWPEAESGYYNSCSVETQTKRFPADLLKMTAEEIAAWKIDQRAKYDADQKIKKAREAQAAAERQRANELATLAALKEKYGA